MTYRISIRKSFSWKPLTLQRRLIAVLSVVAMLVSVPLASPAGVVDYVRDRGEDLIDILRLRFVVPYRGDGYGAKVRVTSLAQAGFIHLNGDAYGMDRRAIGHVRDKRVEGGVSLLYFTRNQMAGEWGNGYLDSDDPWNQAAYRGIIRNGTYWDDGRHHPLSVGAEVELVAFGIDVGVYPTEAIDFALGWLFLDIYKDDRSFTDALPEFGTGEEATEEELPQFETIGYEPLLPEEPVVTDEPLLLPEVTEDTTVGSEFLTPSDVEAFQNEDATAVETIDTPLPLPETTTPEPQPESTDSQ